MSVNYYGKIAHGGGSWTIVARPDVMIRLRRIFPRVQSTYAGQIVISATPDVARDLEWMMARWPMEMDAADRMLLSQHADRSRDTETAITKIMAGERIDVARTPSREPRHYQVEAADMALTTGSLLIVHAVGSGKSFTGLLALRAAGALPALVVTLGGVLPNQWKHQLELAFPDMLGYVLPTGDIKDRLRIMRKTLGRDPDVLILPYSRLQKWQDYLKGAVRTVIYDEIQELRWDNTEKYAAAMSVSANADVNIGLTATPIYGYGDQMHTVCNVLRPGALGTRSEFLREWGGRAVGTTGQHDLAEITPLSFYMREIGLMHLKTREDIGREIPEPVRVPFEIDIDQTIVDKAMEGVADIARRYLADDVKDIDKMQYGSEIDIKLRHATGVAKAPHVADLVKLLLESEEKILLFGWHHDVYRIWTEQLIGYDPVLYTGKESTAGKQRSMEAFIHGRSRVLMMSLRAGAGIDGLQEVADVAVFGELDWSPAIHTQNIGRVARDHIDGRVKTGLCTAYFCTTDYGSDPLVEDVLSMKQQQSDGLIRPDTPLVTQVDTSDRIAQLAQLVLARSGK